MTHPPINIYSGSKGLGAELTNPTVLSKKKGSIKQDYPVKFFDKVYPDAETAYQELKSLYPQPDNLKLLSAIIAAKLIQHPKLMAEINNRGGSDWLCMCEHKTFAKTKSFQWWEGVGVESPMIKCLVTGYLMARLMSGEDPLEACLMIEQTLDDKQLELL